MGLPELGAESSHLAAARSSATYEQRTMSGKAYDLYKLAVLTSIIMVAYSDRYLIGIVLESMKADLGVSDTQLGIVTGMAFAAFYSMLGIPIGRLADRGNRLTVVSVSMSLWAAMVMACGLVSNFWQLVVVRIGAAVGESGSMPATYSLMGDYFRGRALTRAMTIYMTSPNLCVLVGFLVGGWLADEYGWRTALLLAGLPGLILAVLAKLTLPEPRSMGSRTADLTGNNRVEQTPPFIAVVRTMWYRRSCRHIVIALVCWQVYSSAVWTWVSPILIRNHGMTASEIGVWLGLGASLAGIMGTSVGGYLFDRLMGGRDDRQIRIVAIILVISMLINTLFLLVAQKDVALYSFILVIALSSSFYGPVYAITQRLVTGRMRATSMSIILMSINLLGLGSGPAMVGVLSDAYRLHWGSDSLRLAMLTISAPAILAASTFFWRAARTVKSDLHEASLEEGDPVAELASISDFNPAA